MKSVCAQFLGRPVDDVLTVQVARVLESLLGKGHANRRQIPTTPQGVLATFKSRGLIPDYLVDACAAKEGRDGASAGALESGARVAAVCFAASVYPQQVKDMNYDAEYRPAEMTCRLEAFWPVLCGEDPRTVAEARLRARGMEPDEFSSLLSVLNAASSVPEEQPQEAVARKDGAALFLSTCTANALALMVKYWRTEQATVDFLVRNRLAVPPSSLFTRTFSKHPDWGQVRGDLRKKFEASEPVAEAVARLERSIWYKAEGWPRLGMMEDGVRECWENISDRLTSGFPYYAFQASLMTWWRSYIEHFRFARDDVSLDDEGAEGSGGDRIARIAGTAVSFTPQVLHWIREGFRFVRSTFFDRERSSAGQEPESRRIADYIWGNRLWKIVDDIDEPASIEEVIAHFGEGYRDRVNDVNRRLRMRMWAYMLARVSRFSNDQVRSCRVPVEYLQKNQNPEALRDEHAVETIASLARGIPLDNTLLWAFTTHVFLQSLCDPQHADHWDYGRFVRELWYWVVDDEFDGALRHGASRGWRVDAAALRSAAFAQLCAELRTIASGQPGQAIANNNRFSSSQGMPLELLLLQDSCAFQQEFRGCLKSWRAQVRHWIAPAWYMSVALGQERVDRESLLKRLMVDEGDLEAINDMLDRMSAVLAVRGSSAGQVQAGTKKNP